MPGQNHLVKLLGVSGKTVELERDPDVLDTWFSSALWPFSTLGWPDETPELEHHYPTSVLVTGFDIIFFWVARMMMMGEWLTDQEPFSIVYLSGLIRDPYGKKMSKTKGNVIDPLNIIEKYGTDAFRFTLAAFAAQGRDVKMSEKRVEGYRNFVNKLWNATRFALMHLKEGITDIPVDHTSLADKWILSRLGRTATKVSEAIDDYRFNEAASAAYNFVWHELCDWYIEAAKPALYGKKGEASQQATLSVLWRVLRDTLILLHPFMPFVTEEIWHKLPGTRGSIMKAVFPTDTPEAKDLARDAAAEEAMQTVIDVITGVRNIRGEMNVAPSLTLKATLRTKEVGIRKAFGASNGNLFRQFMGESWFSRWKRCTRMPNCIM